MPPIDSRVSRTGCYAANTSDSKTDPLNLSIDKAIITNSPLINTSVAYRIIG